MNFLHLLIGVALLNTILTQAVKFHQATNCRQKTWLLGVEGITRSLIPGSLTQESFWLPECKILIKKNHRTITTSNKRRFSLSLKGYL